MTSVNVKYDQSLISKTIDWLRFPMAVLVVFIHADGALSKNDHVLSCQNGLSDIMTIIFSQGLGRIAVPVFFIISGYLFFKGLINWSPSVWLNNEKKRVKSLLVPYFLWNLIALFAYLAFWIVKSKLAGNTVNLAELMSNQAWLRIFWDCNTPDAEHFVNAFGLEMNNIFPIDRPLWFIRDLMVLTLCAPIIYLLAKFVGVCVLGITGVLMILSVGFPFNENFTIGLFFFLFGSYYMINEKNFIDEFSQLKVISAIILCASLIGVTISYNNPSFLVANKILVNFSSVQK